MKIEQIQPELVAAVAPLVERLAADAQEAGVSDDVIERLVGALPPKLRGAGCFLDKLTGLWRYEFGEPFYLEGQKQVLWGAHMWVPVMYLRRGLLCCLRRVRGCNQRRYLERLDEPAKHHDVLSEMIPLLNVSEVVAAAFEVAGKGNGNSEIDWLVGPVGGREILFDVKSRSLDLIQQMDKETGGNTLAPPDHDAALMFRSLEKKFLAVDSNVRLQGGWLTTHIKQERAELEAAFLSLDPEKIHFAILGHWEPGGSIFVRNPLDRNLLSVIFGVSENERFLFQRTC